MLIAAALLAAGLLAVAALVAFERHRAPALAPAELESNGGPPLVTVLLPVRDEEADVVACVETLLGQTARPRVRVVDDGSSDRTVERVEGLIASLPAAGRRLEIVSAGELPDGWRGKVHALARGLAGIDSPWILTTDADTRHAPAALARALATAQRDGLDLLSLAGHQKVASVGEALLTPPVFALLDRSLGDWRPQATGTAASPLANGQFLLMRREALLAAGGFEVIRHAALDDVALARAFQSAGLRTGFVRALDLLDVRMYRGLVATWRGWRRNLALIFGPQPGRLWAIVLALATPGALALAALAGGAWRPAAILWVGGVAASALLRATSSHPLRHTWLWPWDSFALALLLVVARRDFRRRRLAAWKGRPIVPDQPGESGAS